ncbi:MAG: peptidylprolyl isomerase [Planctomycetes bacterium]|nr:peptidylprolyl isomerase [Planctomycetota bacterium]
MAQHKAPTAVTIAATSEKSGLALLVERYWKFGLVAALAITAVVLFRVSRSQAETEELAKGWDSLVAAATKDPMGGLTGAPADLRTIAEREPQSQAAPWALFIAARAALEKRDYDAASASLETLRTNYGGHPLLQQTFAYSAEGAPISSVQALAQRLDSLKTWTGVHKELFENPAPPVDAPKVRINTDKGAIVVQLYPNLAPKHAEGFLKLAREGFYAGSKFHAIRKGSWILGGDPTTKDPDVSKWGVGPSEPGLELEESHLRHFSGYLGMWRKPGEATSSPSQFYLTTGAAHSQDGQSVLFGKVIEGQDAVTAIEGGATVEGTERPEAPITVQSMELL